MGKVVKESLYMSTYLDFLEKKNNIMDLCCEKLVKKVYFTPTQDKKI